MRTKSEVEDDLYAFTLQGVKSEILELRGCLGSDHAIRLSCTAHQAYLTPQR